MAGMTERLIQLTLRAKEYLSGDVKPASAALQGLTEDSKRLKDALTDSGKARTLARTLRDNEQASAGLHRAWKEAQETLEDLTREVGANADATAGQRIALREARATADAAAQAYKRNQSAIKNTTSELKRLGVDTANIVAEERRLTAELAQNREALNQNREAIARKRVEERAAEEAAKKHADQVKANSEFMSGAVRRVLAFAAAYVSLNAAFGLVQKGLDLVGSGIRSMLSTGDEFELLGKRLTSLMGSVEGGEKAVAWIKQFAKDTPLEVADVTEAFALLKSYGLDPMGGTLQAVVDKNEELGGGMERLTGISSALGQAYAKQKLQTEEILQLVERGVPVWSLLEKVTGKNASQLQDLATKGKLGRDVIKELIAEMGKSAAGAAAANMTTLTGLTSNLSDVWSDFLNRISKSGALDYVKGKLAEVAKTIDQMDKDGRLDALAQALSKAFIEGAGKVEEFAKKLLEVDFNKLTDDSTAWLNQFGSKIDKTVTNITTLTAPIRVAGNVLTTFMSGVGTFATTIADISLKAVSITAKAIPDAIGGDKIRAALKSAGEAVREFRGDLVDQIKQDGQDLKDLWNGLGADAESAADQQAAAAESAADAATDAANEVAAAASANAANIAAVAKSMLEMTIAGQRGIAGMADALQLIDTVSTKEQVEGLRKALVEAFNDGKISQEEYGNAAALLSQKLKGIGLQATDAADGVSDLEEKLGDLKTVLAAISNAKTSVDINNINTALRKLYNDGSINATQFNDAVKKVSARQTELKKAIDETRKSQDAKNDSDQEAIKNSEDLRRESGERMAAERQASGQAMEDRRRGTESAKQDMQAMGDFFGGVITRAREPLAEMSEAALEAFDKLQGISAVDMSLDTSGLKETTASLQKATSALAEMESAAGAVGASGLGKWMADTALRSQQLQVQFLKQKQSLQSLLDGYENGEIGLADFTKRAASARNGLSLLNDSDMRTLESALESARQKMEQLQQGSKTTLASLQEELMGLRGETEALERSKFASRRADLQQQIAEAQKSGDSTSLANLNQAMSTLRQIEDATSQQRQRQEQEKRVEQSSTPAEEAPSPSKIIRLESKGKAVEVAVNSDSDETNLLGILEDVGLRTL